MAVIEIGTIEGKRLEWVGIYSDSDAERAVWWGDTLLSGFGPHDPKPAIRLLDRAFGRVIGSWQPEGFETKED